MWSFVASPIEKAKGDDQCLCDTNQRVFILPHVWETLQIPTRLAFDRIEEIVCRLTYEGKDGRLRTSFEETYRLFYQTALYSNEVRWSRPLPFRSTSKLLVEIALKDYLAACLRRASLFFANAEDYMFFAVMLNDCQKHKQNCAADTIILCVFSHFLRIPVSWWRCL